MLSSRASVRGYFIEFIKKLRQCWRNFLKVIGLVRIESEIRILWAEWRASALNLHTLPKNGLMSFSIKHKLIIWVLFYCFFHYYVFNILKFHNIVSCGGSLLIHYCFNLEMSLDSGESSCIIPILVSSL